MVNIFTLTTRGLEDTCAQEMSSISGLNIRRVAYRRVAARYNGPFDQLLSLRTVDDLFIELGVWKNIATQRSGLIDLRRSAASLNLETAVQQIAQVRNIPSKPGFSVTASFVGKRNYNTQEIKQAVADGITTRYPWPYIPEDHSSNLNIRIFIEHDIAYAGVRISQKSLQKRGYKQSHTSGSLKPPVAAAMLILANPDPRFPIFDPFCGAGTILIEASQMGYAAAGGDIAPEALQAARENSIAASVKFQLHRWDALHLPLANRTVHTLVTNIPWGVQIDAGLEAQFVHRLFMDEIERVLADAGRIAILTNHPELVYSSRLRVMRKIEISLFGQTPSIVVLAKQ